MEEEIIKRRVPGFVFSTFLFFLFYLLLRTIWNDIPLMFYRMTDAAIAEDEPLILCYIFAALDLIMLCLSFWSIIRILKGTQDGLTCLRWTLWIYAIVAFYHLMQDVWKIIYISWYCILPFGVQLLFALLFIIYTHKSSSIIELYPKSSRKYYPGGYIWLAFFVFSAGAFSYCAYSSITKQERAKPIDIDTLKIPKGYLCDGRIMFKSDLTWKQSTMEILSVDLDTLSTTLWTNTTDSLKTCWIWGGVSEKARHSDFIKILLQSKPVADSLYIGEIASCDTTISGEQYYIEQYRYSSDSISHLWTFAVRFDSKSNKYCALSTYSKKNAADEYNKAINTLQNVLFDLKPYIKKP